LAPSGAGLLKVKVFWRQKARVVLRLKISGMIYRLIFFITFGNLLAFYRDGEYVISLPMYISMQYARSSFILVYGSE
jgi:hypothetical protein